MCGLLEFGDFYVRVFGWKVFFEVEINIDIYRRIIKVDLYFFFFVFEGVRDFILKVSGIYMEIFI